MLVIYSTVAYNAAGPSLGGGGDQVTRHYNMYTNRKLTEAKGGERGEPHETGR